MKNNTESSKSKLLSAIQSLPQDFALTEARQLMNSALQKIEIVEQKRSKRELKNTPHAEWQGSISNGITNPLDYNQTVQTIDQMIAEEKAKLETLKENRKNVGDEGQIND